MGRIEVATRRTPVVDLPLGATEDRVVGSLDVERAIKEGIKALEPGILATANRGILYIDEVNLLDDHVADVLLDSAAMGVNIVEREGVSVAHPSKFILVGTMNPEEGELRPQLLDRFGLQISVQGIEDVEQRMEIARRSELFEADPEGFAKEYRPAKEELRRRILQAKDLLKFVKMDDGLLRIVASTCVDLGIKTHRAEIVITRTAKTIAAFEGRREVDQEDVRRAMALALAHRMRSRPFEPPALNKERLEQSLAQHQQPEEMKKGGPHQQSPEGQDMGSQTEPSQATEKVFSIGDPIDVRQISMHRHRDRTVRRKTSGRRIDTLNLRSSGRYLRHRFPRNGGDIAIDATIRAAAPYQRRRKGNNAINVRGQDIREKERVRKGSALVMFVVDASG
jgi:magnesium chelatase subunit D